jgi:flagellar protein FlbD
MMGGSEHCHLSLYYSIIIENSRSVLSIVNHLMQRTRGGCGMIEVTRLNDIKLIINADMIEKVEEAPDTIITLTSGNKIIVKESRQEIKNLVILYKKEVFSRDL